MKYRGKISFTIDREHPDFKYAEDWTVDKIYTFEDVYTFDNDHMEESIVAYIKRDLRLVAGGGYNAEHIHNVTFEIERV